MNLSDKFRSLSVSTQKIFGLLTVLFLAIALPLFIWALITQKFLITKHAATGEPGVCVPQNNIIIVTPTSDTTGDCHNIQTAIDAVTGDGYTIQIEPGTYTETSTLNVNGKSNLTIMGDQSFPSSSIIIEHTGGGWGILVQNSSGSIKWLKLDGGSSNGMLSIHDSTNFAIGYANLNSHSSHTVDIQGSSHVSIYNTEIQSSAGALEIATSSDVTVSNNKIHNSANAISVQSINGVTILSNLIYGNSESGLTVNASIGNVHDLRVLRNTFTNNGTGGATFATIDILGTGGTNMEFSNNIVSAGGGPGLRSSDGLSFAPFAYNDIYGNNPDYQGLASQTGYNGTISEDPLLNSENSIFCPMPSSPVIYGDVANNEFMGYITQCTVSVTPSPTPTITPSPTPTTTPTPETVAGEPNSCGGTCGSNFNCKANLFCYQGFCRNPDCRNSTNCSCTSPTPTAKSKFTSTGIKASPTSEIVYLTPSARSTPRITFTPVPSQTPEVALAGGNKTNLNFLLWIAGGSFVIALILLGINALKGKGNTPTY